MDTERYREDQRGNLVPIENIKPIDLLRDEVVAELFAKARTVEQALTKLKTEMIHGIGAFIELSAEEYGVSLGGKKGNVTLTSFDGRYKIVRAMDDQIAFDERLQVAKVLIDECIGEWAKDARSEIKVLVNDAFYVDKAGKINTNRILGLRRLDIKHEKWKKAMEAIGDSLHVVATKAYVRVYERDSEGAYKQIKLDMASA